MLFKSTQRFYNPNRILYYSTWHSEACAFYSVFRSYDDESCSVLTSCHSTKNLATFIKQQGSSNKTIFKNNLNLFLRFNFVLLKHNEMNNTDPISQLFFNWSLPLYHDFTRLYTKTGVFPPLKRFTHPFKRWISEHLMV